MRNGLAVVFFAAVSFLANTSVNAAATIGATAITPGSTPAGTALVVTVNSTITDPSLIAASVNLQKLDASGRVVATIGNLHDDGVAGDATAGDKVFSITTTVLENTPGTVKYRVSAAFQGSLVRAFSSPLSVTISGTATGITIQSPANAAYVNTPIVTVNGTVGDSAAQVVVNGVVAPLSGNSFVASIPLNEGPNTLTAVATNTNGTTSTASILVTLDTTPPHVDVYTPEANAVTTESTVNVTGLVNDIVVGTVNPIQATVTVNGVAAQVANRSFAATNVPVSLGLNLFQVVATDRAGNSATASVSVTRKEITEKTLKINRGNSQSGVIRSTLPLPMEVQLVDAAGAPIANTPVVFRVTSQDGVLSQTGAASTGVPALAVNTSAQGLASVFLNLGSRSGVGNNVVEASTTGVANTAVFIASATPAPAGLIVVDAGGNQSGVIGQQLPLPFIAIVTDAGNNRLPGIPVTFSVKKGGGNFAGKPTLVANTDSDGRVMASLTLGPDQGVNNNLVEINFTGNTGFPAVFTATGLTPGPAANTRISGVVLDNSNMPIPGVTMRLLKINQGNVGNIPQEVAPSVRTDARGQFVMQPVPVGVFKLMADGGTATRTGGWPTIEYDMITVPGQDNNVGSPIYLPELIAQNRLCVSETTGGTLTIPQAPGFSLTIIPGSATFPGGARSGCVSVTPVNMDKVPMVPGFGQQPRFVVTIQPVGTSFNPPAAIAIPNVDGLAPRAVTEMYSYDHDLASFVAIGSGTVSEDGSIIRSDPGVGVLKAGWHCGGNPNSTGSAGTCQACEKCVGSQCKADPAKDGLACPSGTCLNGVCQPTEYDPDTAIGSGANDTIIPSVQKNIGAIGASPGEKIILRLVLTDNDRTRVIGSPTWTNVQGTGPYKITLTISGDASWGPPLTPLSGMKIRTFNSLNTENVELFTDTTWKNPTATTVNTITVTALVEDLAPPPVAPGIGTAKDPDKKIEWIIVPRGQCPTSMKTVTGAVKVFRPDPADFVYQMGPDIPPAGRPDYLNQTILESFGAVKNITFTMSDMTSAFFTAYPGLTTPIDVVNEILGAKRAGNGTFVINIYDQIADRHQSFPFPDIVNFFTQAAIAKGIGYTLPQEYSCGGTVIQSYDVTHRYTSPMSETSKTGP